MQASSTNLGPILWCATARLAFISPFWLTIGAVASPLSSLAASPSAPQQRERVFDSKTNKSFDVALREVLIRAKKGAAAGAVSSAMKNRGCSVITEHGGTRIHRYRIPANISVSEFAERMAASDTIDLVEPNYITRTLGSGQYIPTDPLLSSQWGVAAVKAQQAWQVTTGSESVVVAVLDTGIDCTHPDLMNQVVSGYDFINDDSDPTDDYGHGTHVAGIIAAEGNNAIGIAGIAWGCRLMPVKVIDNTGEGTYADVIEGILYATDNGAKVINLSIGGYAYSQILADAVDYAHDKGVVLIAAGGNEGTDEPIYPAAYPNVIAVSATDPNDQIWTSSNWGSYIALAAPGTDITSTYPNGEYAALSGTSASAAFVSGAAALVFANHPDYSNSQVEPGPARINRQFG